MQIADLYAKLGLRPDRGSFDRGKALINGIKTALAAFAGFKLVQGVTNMVTQVAELGGKLNDLSQQTGVSTDTLQGMGHAAKLTGVELDEFAGAMGKLGRNLDQAMTKGTGGAADALRRMGISISSVKKDVNGPAGFDNVLLRVAERFQTMPDGPKKTALAMDLFGRSGARLIPMLNQGRAGLEAAKREAEELGLVMSGGDIKKLDDFGDNIDRAKGALQGLKNTVVVGLLPTLADMLEGFMAWLKANRQLVADTLRGVVIGLVTVLKVLGVVLIGVGKVINFFASNTRLARAVLIALGTVLGALAANALAAWLAVAGPAVLVIAAVTAIILIIDDLIQAFTGGQSYIADGLKWLANKFGGFGRGVKNVFLAIGRFFKGIAVAIKNAFLAVFNWIMRQIDRVVGAVKSIPGKIKSVGKDMLDAIKGKLGIGGGPDKFGAVMPGARGTATGSRAQTASNSITNSFKIDVHSSASDPVAVAIEVDKKLRTFWNGHMRDAHAGVGGEVVG